MIKAGTIGATRKQKAFTQVYFNFAKSWLQASLLNILFREGLIFFNGDLDGVNGLHDFARDLHIGKF